MIEEINKQIEELEKVMEPQIKANNFYGKSPFITIMEGQVVILKALKNITDKLEDKENLSTSLTT